MHVDVEERVERFLAPAGMRHRLVRICAGMAHAAQPPGRPQQALAATVDWLTGPLVDPRSLALHRRVSGERSTVGGLQPAEEDLLLATAYLRVEQDLRSPDRALHDRLRNPAWSMAMGWEALEQVEADFTGELLVEVGLRRARDSVLAGRLREAEAALEWLYPEVSELAHRVREVAPREPADAPTQAADAERRRREFDAAKVAVAAGVALVVGIAAGVQKADQ